MKIKILASASQDLIDGYRFYESQAEGLAPISLIRFIPISIP